jgi:hypothetical protein
MTGLRLGFAARLRFGIGTVLNGMGQVCQAGVRAQRAGFSNYPTTGLYRVAPPDDS